MAAPKQQLSLFDAVCLMLGVIIGAGIFSSTPFVAANVPHTTALLSVWLIGGVLSLLGAFCYAELTSSLPHEGGEYVYLTRAYGKPVGFVFAWCEFWIIRPGSIGAMAYVFATYSATMLPPEQRETAQPILAAASIVVLTVTNLLGVKSGKWTQNVLTVAKVVGLLAVIATGLWLLLPGEQTVTAAASPAAGFSGSMATALVLVLFAYGGWNDISFVAAEVREPQRNMSRALVGGVVAVTAIYLLFNAALVAGLGLQGLASSASAPAQLVQQAIGPVGGVLVSGLICLATLGAINAMIFTGSRIYYALGKEHKLYAFLGHWSERFDCPSRSLVLQSMVALALVLSFGSDSNQFERLVIFTTPLFWSFIMLVAISTVVLRRKLPELERPYRMPFYPLPAMALCLTALFAIYSSLHYSLSHGHVEGFWTLGMLLVGMVAAWIDARVNRRTDDDVPRETS